MKGGLNSTRKSKSLVASLKIVACGRAEHVQPQHAMAAAHRGDLLALFLDERMHWAFPYLEI